MKKAALYRAFTVRARREDGAHEVSTRREQLGISPRLHPDRIWVQCTFARREQELIRAVLHQVASLDLGSLSRWERCVPTPALCLYLTRCGPERNKLRTIRASKAVRSSDVGKTLGAKRGKAPPKMTLTGPSGITCSVRLWPRAAVWSGSANLM